MWSKFFIFYSLKLSLITQLSNKIAVRTAQWGCTYITAFQVPGQEIEPETLYLIAQYSTIKLSRGTWKLSIKKFLRMCEPYKLMGLWYRNSVQNSFKKLLGPIRIIYIHSLYIKWQNIYYQRQKLYSKLFYWLNLNFFQNKLDEIHTDQSDFQWMGLDYKEIKVNIHKIIFSFQPSE